VRRANTLFQLMTILVENHHSFLIVEHDLLLYASAQDPHLQKMTELADLGVLPPCESRVRGPLFSTQLVPGQAAQLIGCLHLQHLSGMLLGRLDVAASTGEGETPHKRPQIADVDDGAPYIDADDGAVN
jgi:hypothetical protein